MIKEMGEGGWLFTCCDMAKVMGSDLIITIMSECDEWCVLLTGLLCLRGTSARWWTAMNVRSNDWQAWWLVSILSRPWKPSWLTCQSALNEWQEFSVDRNLLFLPLPPKTLTLYQEYRFSGFADQWSSVLMSTLTLPTLKPQWLSTDVNSSYFSQAV